MNGKKLNLKGLQFERLTVLEEVGSDKNRGGIQWKCICSCEQRTIVVVSASCLRQKIVRSCGCLQKDLLSQRSKTHGMSKTSTYLSWRNMKSRCDNPNNSCYQNYGGRGIKYADHWKTFEGFYKDMGDKPDDKTLERTDVNGNYCKENCCWADKAVQMNNKTNTIRITYNNETKSITEWSKATGISRQVIDLRLRHGWPIEEALTTPTGKGIKRKNTRQYDNSQKDKARNKVSKAIRDGELVKPLCCQYPECNETVIEAHHESYAPGDELKVVWLCKKHHSHYHPNNVMIEYQGEAKSLSEWARLTGISFATLRCRLVRGWTIEKTLTTKNREATKLTFQGTTKTIPEWSKELGIPAYNIYKRIKAGRPIQEVLSTNSLIVRQTPDYSGYKPKEGPMLITYNNETKTTYQWSNITGLSASCIRFRIKMGWSVEKALTTPPRKAKLITVQGVSKTAKEWSETTGIAIDRFYYRLQHNMTIDELVLIA